MKNKRLVQILAIVGLVALNISTFKIVHDNKVNAYNAELRNAWVGQAMPPAAAHSTNIYSFENTEANIELSSQEQAIECNEVFDENSVFKAELVRLDMPENYTEHQFIRIKATLKNTGEATWYGAGNDCSSQYPVMMLGNMDQPDADSELWNDFNFVENNWSHDGSKNRIELTEKEVKPGAEGTFSFWIETPITEVSTEVNIVKNAETDEEEKDVQMYKWAYDKYTFTPIAGDQWLDNAKVQFTLKLGELPPKQAEKIRFLDEKLDNFKLKDYEGEKNVYIRLSDQTGFLRYGDNSFYSYKISSGAWDKKTPVGDHFVANKQELRIGGKAPHYRMPYWLGLSINGAPFIGYGLHEVPYLGLSRETSDFYERGLKYDLGKNVSHGCVRSGPLDAALLYEFGGIGMPVYVRTVDDDKVFATIDPPVTTAAKAS